MALPLKRSTDDKVLAGVCGGIARTLGTDPGMTRLVVAAGLLFTGMAPLYVVAWLVLADDNGRTGLHWVLEQLRNDDKAVEEQPPSGVHHSEVHRGDDLR